MKLPEEYKARKPPSIPLRQAQDAAPQRGEAKRGATLRDRWRRGAALRRRWRRRGARFLLLLFVLFGLTAGTAPSSHDLFTQVDSLTHARQFDFVDWISMAVAGEIGRHIEPPPLPVTYGEQRALIETFLAQEREIRRLEEQIDQLYATSTPLNPPSTGPSTSSGGALGGDSGRGPATGGGEEGAGRTTPAEDTAELAQTVAGLRVQQQVLLPQVESLLARQIETVLQEEGFTLRGYVFPPVAFRLIDPPTALILSPRAEIKREHFVGLQPGLDNQIRTEIEDTLSRRGDISSYVTNVGGLGSYPSMVILHPDLPYLIDVISHEWTHNYLYTFPTNIAWGYSLYPQLTTINETTASLVGGELSRKVVERFYPDLLGQLPPLDERGQELPQPPSEFDLTMQRVRQKVDILLAQGKIEEAEAYMEVERVKLVEKGYHLRRLNQAYFAFHGSYALSPGSVDPTGPQIRQLRAASASLKDFLDRVGWLNSYEDYLDWLNDE